MVDSTPQPPATPPPPTTPPPPAFPPPQILTSPRRHRSRAIVIGSAAAVIAAIVTTGVVAVRSTSDDGKPAGVAAPSVPDADAVSPVMEPDPEPTYVQVDADSFSIDLRTTARQCFGSAGCNVTVEPELTYLGSSGDLDPDAVYEITYEIHGDQSGPVIQTAELTNRTRLSYTPSLVSTASASTELSVEITNVQQG
ncbi:hypothetical protein [Streptomyces sp. SLBN-8D4]|uniref:hypothetical protein n=1 Tax=Streptomyces sp. SLBN-8D4 TaxID=3377728 RepID=UPI003C7C1D45